MIDPCCIVQLYNTIYYVGYTHRCYWFSVLVDDRNHNELCVIYDDSLYDEFLLGGAGIHEQDIKYQLDTTSEYLLYVIPYVYFVIFWFTDFEIVWWTEREWVNNDAFNKIGN